MSSPIIKKINKAPITLTFYGAIAEIMEGNRVTRLEWDNKGWYCFLKDGLLTIHKPGEATETTHSWIVNDGDIAGIDWIVLNAGN